MDEKCFMKVAAKVAHRTLRLNYSAIYGEPIERLRLKSAFYLTGMDVSKGTFRENENWRRVEAYRRLGEYFRGGPEDWKTLQEMLAFELSNSLSKNFVSLIYFSLMDLAGGGYWSNGKEVEDRVAGHILRTSVSFIKRTEFGNLTWITAVKDSLFYPMCSFTKSLLANLRLELWRENDGYVEGLKNLGGLVYGAVSYDLLLRERVNVYKVAKWQYNNDFYERRDQYKVLVWSEPDIVDGYAPYGLLIMPYFDKEAGRLEKVVLEGGFRMWRVRLGAKDLVNSALTMKQGLEELTPHTREICKKYEVVVSEILSERKKAKAVAAALAKVKGLWNGWVGSLLGGLAKVSEEDEILCLEMMEPPFWPYGFDGAAFMRLMAVTLPINRQVVHVYSHMGKLLAEKVKRAGFDRSAEEKPEKRELKKIIKEIKKRLALLHSKGSGWASDELQKIPPRPLPSIYEQVFHTPTVLLGMTYDALSSISLALGLEPEIPPDPSDLMELDPVKKVWGSDWSKLKEHPEFSNSLDLLRASARLPLGLLENNYDYLETAIRLLPPPTGSESEVEGL
jgi:hypothetical protein